MLLAFVILERASRQMAVSRQEIDVSCDVTTLRGAAGQVLRSSEVCLLKGLKSDRRALLSAALSLLAWFALLTASLAHQELGLMVVALIGLFWLAAYVFAVYKYARVKMQTPTNEQIMRLFHVE